ncbi:MAG: hypothetical protein LH629_14245, partial [Ignavibacteria bacterium]|nr:hypothetical protein [Ignavibacteria bacterium]
MKNKIFFAVLCMLLVTYVANATVLTVSNSPISVGQYTTIQSAIDVANGGDTIYVHGSPIQYAAATINKKIIMIGAGYNVTGTQYNVNSDIASLIIDSIAYNQPIYGTKLIGLKIYSLTVADPTTNIGISRCYFSYMYWYGGNGWIIENNVIGTIYLQQYNGIINNMIIRNNFIYAATSIQGYGTITGSGLLIDHNIIQGVINYVNYAVITNNIFFFANISGSTGAYNSFNNNATISSSADNLPFGTNSGTGNLNNLTPASVFTNGVSAVQTFPTLCTLNWHVKTTSSAHNGGTDGTDCGIYGGASPMSNFTGAS